MAKENITLKMIAEKAGVSQTTVSRYLNGKLEFMSEETALNISRVLEEMGYKTEVSVRESHGEIGLFVSDMKSPFCIRLIEGIKRRISETEYTLNIFDKEIDPNSESAYLSKFISKNMKGLLVKLSHSSDEEMKEVIDGKVLTVATGRVSSIKSFDCILSDSYAAVNDVVDILSAAKIKEIGVFIAKERKELKLSHQILDLLMKKFKVLSEENIFYISNSSKEECIDSIKKFSLGLQGARAVLTLDSRITETAVRYINENRDIYPEMIITGFDNNHVDKLINDKAVLIHENAEKIGYEAASVLINKMEKKTRTEIKVLKTIKSDIINKL